MLNVRLTFALLMALLVVFFFTLSVTLRESEIALLEGGSRFLSSIGYRLQYAGSSNLAAVLGAPSPVEPIGDAGAVPVLLYHGITSSVDRFSMTEATFADQLFALKRAGYRSVTMAEFLAFTRGERVLPDKSFLLTFDDGRRDSFERADPVLEALGYTAVMFVASGASLDAPGDHNRYYLAASDLERMLASGRWELGSHGVQSEGGFVAVAADGATGNFLSSRAWLPAEGRAESDTEYASRVEHELGASKEALESAFSITVDAFSYPFGDYGNQGAEDETLVPIVRAATEDHYAASFIQVWPGDDEFAANYPGDDPYRFRRIEPDTGWDGADLVAYLKRAQTKSLPYDAPLSREEGWKQNWGAATFDDGLVVEATASTTGAFVFLDGTGAWEDYRFDAEIEWTTGSDVSLIARYRNADTMVLCNFSERGVYIEERVDGVARRAAVVPTPSIREGTDPVLSIVVEGDAVSCLENGAEVASGDISSVPSAGGIGMRVWDEAYDAAAITVHSVHVEMP